MDRKLTGQPVGQITLNLFRHGLGLDPDIHLLMQNSCEALMNTRVKPVYDRSLFFRMLTQS